MKNRNVILTVFSIFLGLLLLAGSTGINVLIHHCIKCGVEKTETSMFLPADHHKDDCCEDATNNSTEDHNLSFEDTCCLLKIEKLKLTNYTNPEPVKFVFPADLPLYYLIDEISPVNEPEYRPHYFPVQNKHGGRAVITLKCQLLT